MRVQVNLDNPLRRRLFVTYCYAYLALGLATLGFGIYLLNANRGQIGGVSLVGGILVVFGILRGGNAVYQLVRLHAASSRSQNRGK